MTLKPFSDSDQPRSSAIPRSAMLWSRLPVKCTRCVPHDRGGHTMRSTRGPSRRTMLDLSVPGREDLLDLGRASRRAMTAGGSSTAARMSRSPIVARRRRSDPAGEIRRTPGTSRSASIRLPTRASASCSRRRVSVLRRSIRPIPSSTFCSVRAERPLTSRSWPASAAARSPRASRSRARRAEARTVFGPTPGTRSMSSRPSGTWARSRS